MFVSIGASLKMSRFGAFFIFRDVKKLVTHSVPYRAHFTLFG